MDKPVYVMVVTLALCVMIFVTRALPFMFSRVLKNSTILTTIGDYFPAYIMMLLVVYEVGIKSFTRYPYALPAMIALLVVSALQLWKRTLLLSIFCGVVIYIVIRYFM